MPRCEKVKWIYLATGIYSRLQSFSSEFRPAPACADYDSAEHSHAINDL